MSEFFVLYIYIFFGKRPSSNTKKAQKFWVRVTLRSPLLEKLFVYRSWGPMSFAPMAASSRIDRGCTPVKHCLILTVFQVEFSVEWPTYTVSALVIVTLFDRCSIQEITNLKCNGVEWKLFLHHYFNNFSKNKLRWKH